jgi:hypothetical protein
VLTGNSRTGALGVKEGEREGEEHRDVRHALWTRHVSSE